MLNGIIERITGIKQPTGLKAQLLKGALGAGSLKFMSMPLGMAASILLARGLGPEAFGRYAFVMTVITLLSLPIAKGVQQLITREVASYQHAGDYGLLRGVLRRGHQLAIFGSLLIALVLVPLALSSSTGVDSKWLLLPVGLLILPFLGLNAIRSGALRGLGNVVWAQLPEQLARPGVHLLVVAILLATGALSATSALLSQATAAALAFIIGAWLLHRTRPQETKTATSQFDDSKWRRAWMPFTFLAAANIINGQIGILFLGVMGTDAQIAALRIAIRGGQFVMLSQTIVGMVLAPYIVRTYREGNKDRLQALLSQSARGALFVALPIALPFIFLGGPVIGFMFGHEYADLSMTALAILAAAQLGNVACGLTGYFLTMTGNERDDLMAQLIAVAVNVVACIALIPAFGATGAALAAATGIVSAQIIKMFLLWNKLHLRPSVF